MSYRFKHLFLSTIFSIVLFNIGIINSAYAEQKTTANKIQGKVTEIINVSGYTYAEVDTGTEIVWAAGPTTELKKGDTVIFSTSMLMKDFRSSSMDRVFPLLYFINQFDTNTSKENVSPEPPMQGQVKPSRTSLKKFKGIEGGNTLVEIHTEKNNLKGKTIKVRGQVTRFAPDIMGKNWLHIEDGSSFDDLTITTDNTVAIGDIVVIEGKLELDKDFDYGYVFPLIVQDAKVTKE